MYKYTEIYMEDGQWPGCSSLCVHLGRVDDATPTHAGQGTTKIRHGDFMGLHGTSASLGYATKTGWWYTYPSEKYESIKFIGIIIPNIWPNKKCSNPPTRKSGLTHDILDFEPSKWEGL